jgi:hypothetical protein
MYCEPWSDPWRTYVYILRLLRLRSRSFATQCHHFGVSLRHKIQRLNSIINSINVDSLSTSTSLLKIHRSVTCKFINESRIDHLLNIHLPCKFIKESRFYSGGAATAPKASYFRPFRSARRCRRKPSNGGRRWRGAPTLLFSFQPSRSSHPISRSAICMKSLDRPLRPARSVSHLAGEYKQPSNQRDLEWRALLATYMQIR